MPNAQLEIAIEAAWDARDTISPATKGEVREAIEDTLTALDSGKLRVAEPRENGEWHVNQWAKKAVLLSFRLSDMAMIEGSNSNSSWWDKVPNKWAGWGENQWQAAGFKEHWDFWRPEGDPLGANTNAYYPRVARNGGKNTNVQSRYLQNAAYCRLKNIQIGYTLPKTWTEKAGMSSVRVYVSGDNLLTFSDITGIFDPEAIGSTYDANNGKLYPLQRVISVGLNVNF